MKQIAMLMLLSLTLVALGKFSPIGVHVGQPVADEGDDGDGGGSTDDDGDDS